MDKDDKSDKQRLFKETWNNESYIDLRQKMLKDEAVANCHQCHERDKASGYSMRKGANQE